MSKVSEVSGELSVTSVSSVAKITFLVAALPRCEQAKKSLLLRFKEHIAQYCKLKKEFKIAAVDNDNSDIEASPGK